MKTELLEIKGTWRSIANAARTTIGLNAEKKEVSSDWKRRILLAEHSPIRKLIISWKWFDIFWWIQTHFTRHKYGVEWFVSTSRSDRTGINRNELTHNSLVNVEGEANAQAIINISRKRLCNKASPETRSTWKDFLNLLAKYEPELVSVCVPDCIYRGWCYEYKSCNFHLSKTFQRLLNDYRKNINEK